MGNSFGDKCLLILEMDKLTLNLISKYLYTQYEASVKLTQIKSWFNLDKKGSAIKAVFY